MKAIDQPTKTLINVLDRPPAGWHALDVMKSDSGRKWDWIALMVDVPPDELKHCLCKTAFLYVLPNDYKPVSGRVAQEAWVRVPGKHRNKEVAWEAAQDMVVASMH